MSSGRARRLTVLVIAVGLVTASFLLPEHRPLPFELCMLHRLTGLDCPTCGLTRSVCLFARGEWRASLSMHPAGGLVFSSLAVACPWIVGEAAANRDLGSTAKRRLVALAFVVGAALSVLVWIARLVGVWSGV